MLVFCFWALCSSGLPAESRQAKAEHKRQKWSNARSLALILKQKEHPPGAGNAQVDVLFSESFADGFGCSAALKKQWSFIPERR
jgi:hypothetical protein